MKKSLRLAVFGAILLISQSHSWGRPLVVGSPERVQLEAMGYEFEKEDGDDESSIASTNTGKILVSKRENVTILSRLYSRRKNITEAEELKLLKKINDLHLKYSYQVVLGDGLLQYNLYAFGPHNTKTFSQLVRLIEKTSEHFDDDEYLKLLK